MSDCDPIADVAVRIEQYQKQTKSTGLAPIQVLSAPSRTDRRLSWRTIAILSTSLAFERSSKRRRGYPSETNVKRGLRFVHGNKELIEKLGRNDPCPCGSGLRFQAVLPKFRVFLTASNGMTIGGINVYEGWREPALLRCHRPKVFHCGATYICPATGQRTFRQRSGEMLCLGSNISNGRTSEPAFEHTCRKRMGG